MNQRNTGFFKGVAITAQHALPKMDRATLQNDAIQLSSISIPEQAGGEEGATTLDPKTSLAISWLDIRKGAPHRALEPTEFTASMDFPRLKVASVARVAAEHCFEDQSLAALFGGVQTGLSLVRPEFSEELLVKDLEKIKAIVPSFDEISAKAGVSHDAVAELIAHEYATFRLGDPEAGLHFISGGFGTGSRFGWLDVNTNPFPADVLVDGTLMGTSPVTQLVATAGTHLVEGRQGSLKARENAKVLAIQRITVDLKLA